MPPGGLPPGELPDGLLLGPYEFKTTAATTTIPRRATITTNDPRGIRLIAGTMSHDGFKDSGDSTPRAGTSSSGRVPSPHDFGGPKVGPARFGLATFRLSAGRSNQAKLRAREASKDDESP